MPRILKYCKYLGTSCYDQNNTINQYNKRREIDMNNQMTKKNIWLGVLIPVSIVLIVFMCILSSIFFKTYLKTLIHFLNLSHFFHLSESNTYPFTVLLLFSGLFLFVLIKHNIKDSLLTFLIFVSSYGVYGYLFATINALGFFSQPLLPSLLLIGFLGSVYLLKKIKLILSVHQITPGVQNIFECLLWTSIFLKSSQLFYPIIKPDLIMFKPFFMVKQISTFSDATIFFLFFIICLAALLNLIILQSPYLKKHYTVTK